MVPLQVLPQKQRIENCTHTILRLHNGVERQHKQAATIPSVHLAKSYAGGEREEPGNCSRGLSLPETCPFATSLQPLQAPNCLKIKRKIVRASSKDGRPIYNEQGDADRISTEMKDSGTC